MKWQKDKQRNFCKQCNTKFWCKVRLGPNMAFDYKHDLCPECRRNKWHKTKRKCIVCHKNYYTKYYDDYTFNNKTIVLKRLTCGWKCQIKLWNELRMARKE